jgi:hypothetical protein
MNLTGGHLSGLLHYNAPGSGRVGFQERRSDLHVHVILVRRAQAWTVMVRVDDEETFLPKLCGREGVPLA